MQAGPKVLRSICHNILAALDANAQRGAAGYATALAQATAQVNDPAQFSLVVLNPTAAAIQAWEGPWPDQGNMVHEIPQAHLIDTTSGAKGGETLQAANLLSVQLHWCQPLVVPFINTVIAHLMAPLASGWDAACYAQGGLPLIAQSTQLMQSTLIPANIQAALGTGAGAAGGPGGSGGSGGPSGGGLGGQPVGGGGSGGGTGTGGSTGGTGSDAPPHVCIGANGTVQVHTGAASGGAT